MADSGKALTEEPVTPQTFSKITVSNYTVDFYSRKKPYRTLKGRDLGSCSQSTFPAGAGALAKQTDSCRTSDPL